jgi:PAS domain S-box-containing protein
MITEQYTVKIIKPNMKPPVRILVIDDDEDDFLFIKEYLRHIPDQQFEVDWCYKYKEADKLICEGRYDLYFVDYLLGAKNGVELIQESIAKNCEEPFILLTGKGNRAIDMKAMESGAVDYLVKSELNSEKLERCIRYSLERASAIKELRAQERKFRNIFERSKDTVFTADETLVFTEVNDAAYTLLEYSKEELLSRSLYSLLAHEADMDVIKEQLATSGDVSDKEVEIITKNGDKKNCILTLSKEKEITGDAYVQGIMHDITSLKKAEKNTLLLEKLNTAGRLVRLLAHEVRNPLSNIMLSAEQMEVSDNPELQSCMDIIKRNSKRIGDLITELLNSSKRDPVTVEKRSLQNILDETIDAAIDRINLRHIKLNREYPQEPAWIMADNEKIKIAFLNVIINAVEAMEENEGRLDISIRQRDHQYMVSIQDNGSGIKEENMSHVFEPYFTSKKNGMGLGLASTLNILQSHNATYDVQSEVDHGTVFKLFFNMA